MNYLDFLRTKIEVAPVSGFALEEEALHPALRGGRRALFESFGLGKTVQELEYCRQVLRHEGGRALIVMPLGVRQEFHHDAIALLGMEPPRYIRRMDEAGETGIFLTNYERVRDGEMQRRKILRCAQNDKKGAQNDNGTLNDREERWTTAEPTGRERKKP